MPPSCTQGMGAPLPHCWACSLPSLAVVLPWGSWRDPCVAARGPMEVRCVTLLFCVSLSSFLWPFSFLCVSVPPGGTGNWFL